jgi:hypothetical protein
VSQQPTASWSRWRNAATLVSEFKSRLAAKRAPVVELEVRFVLPGRVEWDLWDE